MSSNSDQKRVYYQTHKHLWRAAYQKNRKAKLLGAKEYAIKNRDKLNKYARDYRAKNRSTIFKYDLKKYGITLDEYRNMLSAQHYVCAICNKPETAVLRGQVQRLSVDHDHHIGTVRGLLCRDCNRGIGEFQDDPLRLEAAANYLRGYRDV